MHAGSSRGGHTAENLSRAGELPATGAGRAGAAAGGVLGVVVVVGLVVVGRAFPPFPTGSGAGHGRAIRVAVVQGGGRRGLSQLQVPASDVFRAAIKETAHVPRATSLIVWPEDVVALNRPLAGSPATRGSSRPSPGATTRHLSQG